MMAFNPEATTRTYIDGLGAEALAKAADYTIGNHWLLLWGLLVSALVTWIIVRTGLLDRIAAKLSARGFVVRTLLVCAVYFLVSAILTLPWALYTDYFRQHAYDLSSQPLGDYLMQGSISLLISALLGGLFFVGIYALIRKTGRRWWIWSGGLAAITILAMLLLGPVLIEPLFNDYKPLPDGEVEVALVAMAEEAGISEDRIFVYDGSRQSENFTANVSGIGGSARIAISDVALTTASLDEVKAVTGHEIGHYVLGHIWRYIVIFPLLAIALFFLADRLYLRFAKLFGSDAEIGDPRGLPVLIFIVSLFSLLTQPITNALTRSGEREADAYSLETAQLPDALASALLKTAEYRYARPHPVQEMIFYTHPSVEKRVRNAMDWKAANMTPTESRVETQSTP